MSPSTTAGPPEGARRASRRPLAWTVATGAGGAVLAVAGLRAFADTAGAAFLALVLVIVVHPVQSWLQRHGVPGWLSVTGLLVVVYAFVLGVVAGLAWSVVRLAVLLPAYTARFLQLRDQVVDLLSRLGVGQAEVSQVVRGVDTARVLGVAQTVLGQLTTGLSNFLLVLLLLFFLALDAAPFPKLLAQAAWAHPDAVAALTAFATGTRRFLVVSTVFGLAVAALDVAALYWLAVPLPLLWGLWSFLTNYIANIGFVLGLVPPALLALLANGPADALLVVVVYTVVNVVVQGLVQPAVVGGSVGLSATLTFVSVVFWGFALGSLGALLAVPLSLLARAVLLDADPAARWLLPFVSGTPRGVRLRGARLGRTRGTGGASVAPPPPPQVAAPPPASPEG